MQQVMELHDVHYRYEDGTPALQGVSLCLGAGERVGLVGPNGAGKSTLLLHLNGVLRAQKGVVRILGAAITNDNLREVRQRVGLVFQDPDDQLFMPTVFDDVAFGPRNAGVGGDELSIRVHKSLEQVGMADFQERSSQRLSFGEKKRLALATVLSMSVDLLALDEPASNLDPRARRDLISLLRTIDTTMIISGHDLELICAVCSRVVVLDDGRVVANGRPLEVLANGHLMHEHGLEVPFSIKLRRHAGQRLAQREQGNLLVESYDY